MARAICSVRIGPFAVAAGATKTLMQLEAPANQGVAWLRASVSFDGVTPADKPVEVQILKQSTAGTGGTAATEVLVTGPGAVVTPQGIVLTGEFSAEPTEGDVIDGKAVHMQSGYEWVMQEGQDEIVYANGRVAVRVILPAGVTTANAYCSLWWEE